MKESRHSFPAILVVRPNHVGTAYMSHDGTWTPRQHAARGAACRVAERLAVHVEIQNKSPWSFQNVLWLSGHVFWDGGSQNINLLLQFYLTTLWLTIIILPHSVLSSFIFPYFTLACLIPSSPTWSHLISTTHTSGFLSYISNLTYFNFSWHSCGVSENC